MRGEPTATTPTFAPRPSLTPQSFTVTLGGSSINFAKPPTLKDAELLSVDLFGHPDLRSLTPAQAGQLRTALEQEAQERKAREALVSGLSGEQQQTVSAWLVAASAMSRLINMPAEVRDDILGLPGGLRGRFAGARQFLGALPPASQAARILLGRNKLAGFAWGGKALTDTEAPRVDFQVPLGNEASTEEYLGRAANYAEILALTGLTALTTGGQFKIDPVLQDEMRPMINALRSFADSYYIRRGLGPATPLTPEALP
jgi:hypothetical protein